jgi:hypothetical protein
VKKSLTVAALLAVAVGCGLVLRTLLRDRDRRPAATPEPSRGPLGDPDTEPEAMTPRPVSDDRRAVTARSRFHAALSDGRLAEAEEIVDFLAGRVGNEVWVANARRRLAQTRQAAGE